MPDFLFRDRARALPPPPPEAGQGLRVDELDWPIVEVRLGIVVGHAQVAYLLSRLDHWFGLGCRFGMLLDARGSAGFTDGQRDLVAAHLLANVRAARQYLVQAIVVHSPVRKFEPAVVSPVVLRHVPSLVFSDVANARHWLERRLGLFRLRTLFEPGLVAMPEASPPGAGAIAPDDGGGEVPGSHD